MIKAISKIAFLSTTVLIQVILTSTASFATPEYQIQLSEPTFVLPQFKGPFRKREASVAPEEYEMAEQLRGLLEDNKHQEALDILDDLFTLQMSPAMVHLKAQIYLQLEKYEDAEQTFLEVLDRMPQLVRAHADLAQLYMLQEKYLKARHHFAKAVSYGANDAVIHGQLGFLNMQQHNAWSAISAYQNALALEPENPQWQQGLLTALSSAHMYESALAFVDELIKENPSDKELWLQKTSLNLQVDNLAEALSALEMAIRLGADDSHNIATAAQMHLQLDSFDRGLDLLQKSFSKGNIDINTFDKALAWFLHQDLLKQAEALIKHMDKQMHRLDNESKSRIYFHKAQLHVHKKHIQKAIPLFDQAITLNPTNGDALIGYAEALRKQKKFTKAELHYSRASSLDTHSSQAIRGKIRLYIDMLDYQSALDLLRSEFKKNPQMYDLKENIQVIEKILEAKKLADV